MQVLCINRKARFEYEILAKYEAGMVLLGGEVKAVRTKKCSIAEAYVAFRHARPVVYNMNIEQYKNSFEQFEPKRVRALLLHKREINKLLGRLQQDSLTLIPIQLFISDGGFIKLEFGLCKGKKLYDKREAIKQRELDVKRSNFRRGLFE